MGEEETRDDEDRLWSTRCGRGWEGAFLQCIALRTGVATRMSVGERDKGRDQEDSCSSRVFEAGGLRESVSGAVQSARRARQ